LLLEEHAVVKTLAVVLLQSYYLLNSCSETTSYRSYEA